MRWVRVRAAARILADESPVSFAFDFLSRERPLTRLCFSFTVRLVSSPRCTQTNTNQAFSGLVRRVHSLR